MSRVLGLHFIIFSFCCAVALGAEREKKASAAKSLTSGFAPDRLEEMGEASRAFADRFVTTLAEACDVVRKNPESRSAAREALRVKLYDSSSVYSIATLPNPMSQLLNLVTLSTLAYIRWVEEQHAKEVFGAGATNIEEAFTEIHEDVWKVASRFFSPQEISDLRQIILNWRKNHPKDQLVAYIRFDDFALTTGSTTADQAAKGFFAQIAEANRNVTATRQFAERTFHYAKRAPRLLQWQTERTAEALLENPDIRLVMEDFHETSVALRGVATEIQRVDERYSMITGVLAQVETILERTDQVSASLQAALRQGGDSFQSVSQAGSSLSEMLNTFNVVYTTIRSNKVTEPPPERPSEPFDVGRYSAAATELARASRDINALLHETEGVIASPAWSKRIEEINSTTQQRINHVSVRAIQIILVFFALLALHSWFVHRLKIRPPGGGHAGSISNDPA
jgi:hypothetical protein